MISIYEKIEFDDQIFIRLLVHKQVFVHVKENGMLMIQIIIMMQFFITMMIVIKIQILMTSSQRCLLWWTMLIMIIITIMILTTLSMDYYHHGNITGDHNHNNGCHENHDLDDINDFHHLFLYFDYYRDVSWPCCFSSHTWRRWVCLPVWAGVYKNYNYHNNYYYFNYY